MVLVLVAGLASILTGLLAFDGLIHRLYSHHHDEWIASGRPGGLFRVPKEVVDLPFREGFSSSAANSRLIWRWVFVTPEWMKQETGATRLVWTMRVALIVGSAAMFAWMGFGIVRVLGT